jgi:hypothetical protein
MYVFVMNDGEEGGRASYVSTASLVGSRRTDLAAGKQRMWYGQAILNTIAQ